MPKPIIFALGPEFLARDGLTETVAAWEDGLRADTGPGNFEWWYFDAHFDDASTAVIVFATKPILECNGPLKPNVSLTITRPDGTKAAQFPLFPPGEFSASRGTPSSPLGAGCDVRVGPNWTRGPSAGSGQAPWRYELHVKTQNLAADLTFTGSVPAWRPCAGKCYFGDLEHYFAWLPSIPYGTVEGTLAYDGKTHKVKGTGYHDHNWGNVGLNEVMDRWTWGRAHIGDYTLIFVEQIAAKKYGFTRMPVIMLAKGGKIIIEDARPLTMQARDFVKHPEG